MYVKSRFNKGWPLFSRNWHILFIHFLINLSQQYFHWKLKSLKIMFKKLVRDIGNCHSCLPSWYWFSQGGNEERTACGKVTLEPKHLLETGFPKASLKIGSGERIWGKTQILEHSLTRFFFSRARPGSPWQLPVSATGFYKHFCLLV